MQYAWSSSFFFCPFCSYTKAAQCDSRTKFIAYYFCEKCMLEFHMLAHKPSVIASAAVYLSLKSVNSANPWTSTLEQYTKYTLEDIMPCAMQMVAILQKAETSGDGKRVAIRDKYAQQMFGNATGAAFRIKSAIDEKLSMEKSDRVASREATGKINSPNSVAAAAAGLDSAR